MLYLYLIFSHIGTTSHSRAVVSQIKLRLSLLASCTALSKYNKALFSLFVLRVRSLCSI